MVREHALRNEQVRHYRIQEGKKNRGKYKKNLFIIPLYPQKKGLSAMSKIYGIRNTDNMHDTHLVIFNRIKIDF